MFASHNGEGAPYLDLRASLRRGVAGSVASDHRRVMEALEAGGLVPTSAEELERLGVANPATVIYELEVSGISIEHVYAGSSARGRRLIGFRLKG